MTVTQPGNAVRPPAVPGRFRRLLREHQVLSGIGSALLAAAATLAVEHGPSMVGAAQTRAEINVRPSIDRCATVHGTASVPEGKGLWLLVKTPNGMVTPLQPITVDSDGRWTMTRTGIGDDHEAGKEFTFHLVALPQKWADYLADIDKRESLPTGVMLPPDAEVLDTAQTVRSGSQDRCPRPATATE
jgi:hypothetical protein